MNRLPTKTRTPPPWQDPLRRLVWWIACLFPFVCAAFALWQLLRLLPECFGER